MNLILWSSNQEYIQLAIIKCTSVTMVDALSCLMPIVAEIDKLEAIPKAVECIFIISHYEIKLSNTT